MLAQQEQLDVWQKELDHLKLLYEQAGDGSIADTSEDVIEGVGKILMAPLPPGQQTDVFRSQAFLLASKAYQHQHQLQEAFRTIDSSMQLVRRHFSDYGLAVTPQMDQYAFLLDLYTGQYEEAIALREQVHQYLQSLPEAERMGSHQALLINNLIRLVDLKDRTGASAQAQQLIQQTARIVKHPAVGSDHFYRFQLFRLHYLYHDGALNSARKEAEYLLEETSSRSIRPPQLAALRALYGNILYGLGELDRAENYYLQSLADYQHLAAAPTFAQEELLRDLALCYQAQGRYAAGQALLEEQIATVGSNDPDRDWRLADLYASLSGNFFNHFLANKSQPDLLQQALRADRQARQHHYAYRDGLRYVRDIQTSASLEGFSQDLSLAILQEAYQQTQELSYFFEALKVLEQNKNIQLRAQLRTVQDQESLWEEVVIDQKRLLARLRENQQTLVVFHPTAAALFLLAVSDQGVVFEKTSIKGSRLVELIAGLRENIHHRPSQANAEDLQALATVSQELYQLLLQPIETIATSRLLLLPDGPLAYLPFSLLLYEEATVGTPLEEWPFAVRRYSFNYRYTLESYLNENATRAKASRQAILAFAPKFKAGYLRGDGTRSAGALHKNAEEVNYLMGKFPCDAFVGEAARLDAFRVLAGDYAILHLATHAVANSTRGDFSFLAFAETAAPEDYQLRVSDIYQLPISADLVVLSACETGLGEWQAGEGIVGLERAFTAAGAQSLVTTHWKVSDRASALLMKYFYDHLASGLPKDQALQQAQLQFMANSESWLSHPFFWAGFVQKGNTEPLNLTLQRPFWQWVGFLLLAFSTVVYLYSKYK
jgi:CHAT domain-containing protein